MSLSPPLLPLLFPLHTLSSCNRDRCWYLSLSGCWYCKVLWFYGPQYPRKHYPDEAREYINKRFAFWSEAAGLLMARSAFLAHSALLSHCVLLSDCVLVAHSALLPRFVLLPHFRLLSVSLCNGASLWVVFHPEVRAEGSCAVQTCWHLCSKEATNQRFGIPWSKR